MSAEQDLVSQARAALDAILHTDDRCHARVKAGVIQRQVCCCDRDARLAQGVAEAIWISARDAYGDFLPPDWEWDAPLAALRGGPTERTGA